MTTSHSPKGDAAARLPAEKRHARLSANATVSHTEAGRFAVPLDLCEGPAERVPLTLILTAEEAAKIHAELGTHLATEHGGDAA
ncbi:hypothetical protein [Streptomyces longispororuber]|uniref:hypothetical protein n=1 Tax=Streptomyces longispororuber TaxID=68230 RepID=UPI0036FD721D